MAKPLEETVYTKAHRKNDESGEDAIGPKAKRLCYVPKPAKPAKPAKSAKKMELVVAKRTRSGRLVKVPARYSS